MIVTFAPAPCQTPSKSVPVCITTDSSSGWPASAWVTVACLAVALAVVAIAWVATRRARSTPRAQGSSTGSAAPDTSRDTDLVDGVISAYDLSESEVVRAHLRKVLRSSGVTMVAPERGDAFDRDLHTGVSAVTAQTPAQDQTVADLVRVGWVAGATVLRPAEVEVYVAR